MTSRYRSRRHAEPFLTALERAHPVQPAPSRPAPFVGRSAEHTRALEQLAAHGVVGLTGMAGSGKTALAAAITTASAGGVHWVEIDPAFNSCHDAFLWQIAVPLATAAPVCWRALHRVQQSRWCYPPLVRLQMILDGYAALAEPLVLCLDNVERATDTGLISLLIGLTEYVIQTPPMHLKLVLSGQELPYRLEPYALPPLGGLTPAAIEQWASGLLIELERDGAAGIAARTGGLPQALAVVFSQLRAAPDSVSAEHLAALPGIRRFVQQLLRALPAEAQQLLQHLALRSDHVASTPLDRLPQLDLLDRRGLTSTTAEQTIAIHPLLRHFIIYYRPEE